MGAFLASPIHYEDISGSLLILSKDYVQSSTARSEGIQHSPFADLSTASSGRTVAPATPAPAVVLRRPTTPTPSTTAPPVLLVSNVPSPGKKGGRGMLEQPPQQRALTTSASSPGLGTVLELAGSGTRDERFFLPCRTVCAVEFWLDKGQAIPSLAVAVPVGSGDPESGRGDPEGSESQI